jgi:hypothetical protein
MRHFIRQMFLAGMWSFDSLALRKTGDNVDRHRNDVTDIIVAEVSKCAMKQRSASLELSIQKK